MFVVKPLLKGQNSYVTYINISIQYAKVVKVSCTAVCAYANRGYISPELGIIEKCGLIGH